MVKTDNKVTRIIIGSAIIVFGLVILIDLYIRFIDIEILLEWWPVIFLGLGFALLSAVDTKSIWLGVCLMLAGVVAVMERVGILSGDLKVITIAITVLLAGLVLIPLGQKKIEKDKKN